MTSMEVLASMVAISIIVVFLYATERYAARLFDSPEYLDLLAKTQRLEAALEDVKGRPVEATQQKRHDRDVASRQSQLSSAQAVLQGKSMWTSIALATANMVLFYMITSLFAGVVMFRLPFEPFSLVRAVTHRGLAGEDFREASATCLFVLLNLGLKPLVNKLVGSRNAKGADNFMGKLFEAQREKLERSR